MKNQITIPELRARLAAVHSRIPFAELEKSAEFLKQALEGKPSDEEVANSIALQAKARAGDKEAAASLQAIRNTQINNYAAPMSNWASLFFEPISLGAADSATYTNETSYEVKVGYLGEDGRPKSVRAVAPQESTLVPLRGISTEAFGYRLFDLQKGPDIAQSAKASVNIAFDLAMQKDMNARTLMKAAVGSGGLYGAFNSGTSRISKTFVTHSSVLVANLPTTNELAPATGNSGSSKFRLDVVKEIVRYCDKFSSVFPTPLRPTGIIIVPSIDAMDLADELTPLGTSGAFPQNSITEALLQNYTTFSYLGIKWTIVPDATIPSGQCYPVLNKPIGQIFSKPAYDEEFVETMPKKNWEERSMRSAQGIVIPEQWRVNGCRVTYKT